MNEKIHPENNTNYEAMSIEELDVVIEAGMVKLDDYRTEVRHNPDPERRDQANEGAHQQLGLILKLEEIKGAKIRQGIEKLRTNTAQ